MTKSLVTLATMLLAGSLAFAQAGQAGMQGNQSSMDQNTVRGCLTGTAGNYRLVTSTGTTYQLKGDDSDFSDNVGKEVEIQASSAIPQASASASAGAAGQSASSKTAQTIQVEDVTKVADTCQSGAGMRRQGQSGAGQSGQYGGQSGQSGAGQSGQSPNR